jgi:hypothetical protein
MRSIIIGLIGVLPFVASPVLAADAGKPARTAGVRPAAAAVGDDPMTARHAVEHIWRV